MVGELRILVSDSDQMSVRFKGLDANDERRAILRRTIDSLEVTSLIRAIREEAKISRRELADRIGVTVAEIEDIEKGAQPDGPSYVMLKAVARACRAPLQVHLGGIIVGETFEDDPLSDEQEMDENIELLNRAGGALTIGQAAYDLDTSGDDLLKDIREGRIVAIVHDYEVQIPILQLHRIGSHVTILSGIREIVSLFDDGDLGPWHILDFLATTHPVLETQPIERLRSGELAKVMRAARIYVKEHESQ